RGPQSALWGSDAIGGVVHIITKSGRDAPGVGGYLEAGSENTLNAAMNGGFGGDTWSVVVGVEQLATDGSNISRSGSENDDSDITTGSLNARFKPSDRIAVQLGLRTVDAYSQFDAVDFVETGLPTDSDVATDTAQRLAQLGVTLGSSENRVRHHLNARYFDSDNRDLTDGFAAASSTSDRLNLGYQADIRIGKNLLAIALEHEKTNFEQRGEIVWGDPNQDQEMDVMSVVTDFQGRATDNVTYLLSARFDDNSDFDNVVTGRASIAWDVSDATTLRANIGTGQKTPTFIERFGYFPGQFKGNPALKPEQSLSYDIGLDQRIAASAVIQIAVFEQEIEDEIDGFIFDPDTLLYTADNLSTTSKRSGVELGARWTVSEQLDLTMNYTYTDATENGAIELRRPRHAGSMQANYSFMSARGHIALAADYGGTRRDMFFPPWPNPSELVTLGNYWLLDLTAQFQLTESVRLFARASNLLDTDYEQVYGYRTPGRAAYAGVQVNFGQ
ncbi:MAG: TonB-dependent receptor, partial [Gammaproteobacteria bacterium]|nr:TonB-dependent receptor [Gammaproteobacteria bacterium]